MLARFENTGVRDQIARLCIDGTAKFPTFLIPTIERQLELGGPLECAALALAGWARYLATVPAAERAPDPHGERSAALAARVAARTRSRSSSSTEVFTPPLRESARFREAFAPAAGSLAELGPLGAIERLPPSDGGQALPPETSMFTPVTYDASSESRKATTRATSSVEP